MDRQTTALDLRRLAAEQVAACLEHVPVGASLPVDSSSDLCDTLELLIPAILRQRHDGWAHESIDGFLFSSAIKTAEVSAQLAGVCILISDQTVTPFVLNVSLSGRWEFESFRIRLGEPGGGVLGISGPPSNSGAAHGLLSALDARLGSIDWVYEIAL